MAIPKKPGEKNSPLHRLGRKLLAIPDTLKEIPSLPKGKLIKLTSLIVCSIFGVLYCLGPRHYIETERRLREARILERSGVKETSTKLDDAVSRPYSQSYGLDFREKSTADS